MIEFGGIIYYIDLDAMERTIALAGVKPTDIIKNTETKTILDEHGTVIESEQLITSNERGKEIDATKYEVIRLMLEIIMDDNEESDDSLGVDRALEKTPLSFKIAFNTLYNYGILKEKE